MKKSLLLFRLLALMMLAMSVFLGGCAPSIPLAANPPLYPQEKLQAADHWDNVANEVAMRIQKSLEDRPDLVNKPIYVQLPNSRPFSIAFYNLLKTRLVSKGMQVSDRPEMDSILLEYSVQTILYEGSRTDWLPSLAGMGIGIANAFAGQYSTTSDHEIIINASMVHNNRYVMHVSHIHYINDDDWALYMDPNSFDVNADTSRQIRLVKQ